MMHYGHDDGSYATACGAATYDKTTRRTAVTCKRCLAQRRQRFDALMQLLRIERGYSDIAARRWRLACWVLGRCP